MNTPARSTESRSIVVEYDLPHSPAKVWRALTDPDLLAQWLMANDMRPVVGHKFKFTHAPRGGWDGVCHCEVLEVDEPRRLRYTWRGNGGNAWLDSVVTWTLTPTPSGGTHLMLEHAGFAPANDVAFVEMGQGWRGIVGKRLVAVLGEQAA